MIVASFLLAACTIQVNTTVNDDGSGEWRTEFGFNADDIAELAEYEMTPEEFCEDPDMQEDMPPDAEYYIEERGDDTWCVFVIPFSSLDELRQTYEEGEGITVNRLDILDGQFYYDLSIDMSGEDTGMMEEFEFDFTWQLTVPGKVDATNADNVVGNTLTWNLTPGEVISLQAESSTSSGVGGLTGGLNVAWVVVALICLCGLGIVVIAIVVAVFFVIQKRKEETVGE
jgi:hypothetical protein